MFKRATQRSSFVVALVLALVMVMAPFVNAQLPEEVRSKNGMVASAHPLASEAGLQILKAGGNAVDAAVATAFAIGVVEFNASGLGGEGMFVLYEPGTDTSAVIDYRSTAPKLAAETLAGKGMPSTGWGSVAVPGLVAGLTSALAQHGTMTLAEVLQPAIRLAEDGFAIPQETATMIEDNYEKILKDPGLSEVFLDNGLPPVAGWFLKNPGLAASLKKIAAGGPDAFYKGDIAKAIDAYSRAKGGYIRAEDLEAYKAINRTPALGTYRGFEVISAPPPVGGGVLVEILNIIENFELAAEGGPSARSAHIISEAVKRGFWDYRSYVHDPAFAYLPLNELLSDEYAAKRAAEIDVTIMTPFDAPEMKAGEFKQNSASVVDNVHALSPSTTHISVVDKDRNMVAITQTISSFFGAGIMVPGTGVILNNEVYNFSRDLKLANSIAAGKRMRTSISPTILLKDGQPYLTIGTPGSTRIIPSMAQLITNIVDFGMGVQDAINAPRFFVREGSDNFEYESDYNPEIIEGLKKMGYPIGDKSIRPVHDLYFGGAQGVAVDFETGELVGAADPRRAGAVSGY